MKKKSKLTFFSPKITKKSHFFQMLPTEAQFEGNWSGPPQPLVNSDDEEDEDFITFTQSDADYFASAKLDSIEDVSEAIAACKSNILETTENTPGRKSMVNRLIQLQIRQEDLKEKQELSSTTFETRGHTFVNYYNGIKIPGVQDFRTGQVFCQRCTSIIWITLQSAQFCTMCGYGVHYRYYKP